MRKVSLRIFNRLVQCCDRNGAIKVGNGADEILSEEECNVFRKLLSKNISMEFILEMKEAFQTYDKNGDKVISGKEIVGLVRSLGHNPTEPELFEIIAQVDIDHNGMLDFYEFTVMMNDKGPYLYDVRIGWGSGGGPEKPDKRTKIS